MYKGDIWYTPIKEEWYYQIEILKLEIGGQSLNLDCREVLTLLSLCVCLSACAWAIKFAYLIQLVPEYEIRLCITLQDKSKAHDNKSYRALL